ncbi:MAG: cellulose biosynthesis cyclic di-GMP-binding regulatory protein BcsB [Burkholderiales bacterium]
MTRGILRALVALTLASAAVSTSVVAAEAAGSTAGLDKGTASDAQSRGVRVRRATLRQLSGLNALSLRGTDGGATVAFGGRADELVTKAVLRLRYSHSPALLLAQSHLRILLNDETAGIIQFTKETAARSSEQAFELDPRFIGDVNRLRFQFIGHYAADCEDQLHSSLWAEVSGASELELTTRPIPVRSDLALLPEPFFDARDLNRLQLPFVFPTTSSLEMVRAGGIAASWFGQLATWRGARFPVTIGDVVRGHAVVFATNAHRPAFLAAHAPVEGPTLRIATNPLDGLSKLLLVLGRDDADLSIAVEALVRGSAAFSGAEVRVRTVKSGGARAAYDAPNWVRSNRPTKLGELVPHASALQVRGHTPDWIRISLRVPPDLFTWRSRGVPIDFRIRHNAVPIKAGGVSRLTVGVNNELLRSFELVPGEGVGAVTRTRAAIIDPREQNERGDAMIPAFALGGKNQLQFAFAFAVPKDGACRDTYVHNIGGAIDPDSTIDFSGFPHYAALPHLGYFASAGYPFSRFADLSQTIVIMPPAPDGHEIEVFLGLMGRMGESTGLPASAMRLQSQGDPMQYQDADLLMIGTAARLNLLDLWKAHIPAALDGPARRLSIPVRSSTSLYDWLGFGTSPDPAVAARTEVEASGPIAAFIGFESPVTPKRSVVLVTADATASLPIVLDSLEDDGLVRAIHGSTVFMHSKKVESHLVGPTYFVGDLPLWTLFWYHAANHPLPIAAAALIAALLLALVIWRGLRGLARRRLDGSS